MKNVKQIFTLAILAILATTSLHAQPQFGATGSYWTYDYEPHDGNGSGWEMISVEGDTIVNGEAKKILRRTYHWSQNLPPFYSDQDSYIYGTMLIRNDSVFINEKLVLDFNMALHDTLELVDESNFVDLQLVVDSITSIDIAGVSYKKWHGQKICVDGAAIGPYESFEILEHVGQIGMGYLFWNREGCTLGGGRNNFSCYKNGNFSYPPNEDCPELMLVDVIEPGKQHQVTIYPNPVEGSLNIKSIIQEIQKITIYDLSGKLMLENRGDNLIQIDISDWSKGMYLIQLDTKEGEMMRKIVKL